MNTNHYSGRDLLTNLKSRAGAPGPALSLPVGSPVRAWLRPVATRKEFLDADDVSRLTAWRNRFVTSFLNEFVATDRQTTNWLVETVGREDNRILFMADHSDGTTFGYMGLAFIDWEKGIGEADAVVRGEEAPRGLMTGALRTLLDWAQGQLGLREVHVRVRSDNPALEFYRKFGFAEQKRVPLRRTEVPGKIIWVETPDAKTGSEPTLVHLKLPPTFH